jgi:hypothetical protein
VAEGEKESEAEGVAELQCEAEKEALLQAEVEKVPVTVEEPDSEMVWLAVRWGVALSVPLSECVLLALSVTLAL